MPLTDSGNAILDMMERHYVKKKGKGESVFYASMNKDKKGSRKWRKKKQKQDKDGDE